MVAASMAGRTGTVPMYPVYITYYWYVVMVRPRINIPLEEIDARRPFEDDCLESNYSMQPLYIRDTFVVFILEI